MNITDIIINKRLFNMKKLDQILMLCAVAASLSACEKKSVEVPAPVIQLGQTEVVLESDGAAVSVGYLVENSIDGASVVVSEDADWLTVSQDKVRTLEFSASANETGDVRTADVMVSYDGAEDVVISVSQLCYESPLTIVPHEVSATSIKFSVETTNPELTWIPLVASKENFESFMSMDALFEDDMEYFRYVAGNYEVSLEEYLSEMLTTGSEANINFGGLKPEADYVLYVYGLTAEGRRTTDIVSHYFTTTQPYDGDITFSFEVIEEDHIMEFTITPSHTGVPYYCGVATEATVNQWKDAYGTDDLRTAIQKGDIDAGINEYLEWGFIEGPEDYYYMYNESDVMDYGWEECEASTKYIIYAAKWDETCQLIGEVSFYEYVSKGVEPSDNKITVEVGTVTQSSAEAIVTTTNDDRYVVMPVKSSEIAGLSDEELFAYLYGAYDYLLGEYCYVGSNTKSFARMHPDTEYTFLAFGYEAKTRTTEFSKATFKTLPTGDPAECTFEFNVEPDTDYAWVEVTPSDKGHYYHWLVYPASYTVEDARNYISMMISELYENDSAAFASWELSQGDESTTVWDLYPDTEYKVGAVIMDYETGEFLNEMVFSEPFKTLPVTYADITVNVIRGKYFDIAALVAAGHTEYSNFLADGDAIMSVTVTTEGECSEFYYDIYNNDLMDEDTYPDDIFYEGLWYGAYAENATFVVPYDKVQTLVAVAYDMKYEPSRLYREVFTLTKEGASPVEEFQTAATSSVKTLSDTSVQIPVTARIDRRQAVDVRLEEMKVAAKAGIETFRREAARQDVEKRNELRRKITRQIDIK